MLCSATGADNITRLLWDWVLGTEELCAEMTICHAEGILIVGEKLEGAFRTSGTVGRSNFANGVPATDLTLQECSSGSGAEAVRCRVLQCCYLKAFASLPGVETSLSLSAAPSCCAAAIAPHCDLIVDTYGGVASFALRAASYPVALRMLTRRISSWLPTSPSVCTPVRSTC